VSSGLLVRSRRERLREAVEHQRLRLQEARHAERERIAREMHDVLAHRLSLLAVHAGALEVRPSATEQERQAVGVVRQCAHEALEDLRQVIGAVRAAGPVEDRPQPTLADVPALVAQCRRADAAVELDLVVAGAVPDGTGRHAYRIVQEGLTNARKHAPDAPVRVRVGDAPGGGLTIEVVNPASATGSSLPGTGTGLVGLTERARLAGGRLEHGRTADGGFRLWAWLPCRP
jgi:signal transduction histidine kinase